MCMDLKICSWDLFQSNLLHNIAIMMRKIMWQAFFKPMNYSSNRKWKLRDVSTELNTLNRENPWRDLADMNRNISHIYSITIIIWRGTNRQSLVYVLGNAFKTFAMALSRNGNCVNSSSLSDAYVRQLYKSLLVMITACLFSVRLIHC